MGRKRKLRMTVRVVPQGTLRPNPANPFYEESPEQRCERMLRTAALGLARLLRREILEAEAESGGDEEACQGPTGRAAAP
jgi:hypothetical protein